MAALFIFPTLMELIGVSYGEYLKPRAVLESIGALSDRLFGTAIEPSGIPLPENEVSSPDFTQIP